MSVRICSGTPCTISACCSAAHTGPAVARATTWAQTMNREWSSMPVTTFTSLPSDRWTPPITSICHNSIARPRSHRLPGHPEPARYRRHRRPVQHLEDRRIPLLGHTQLHQHRSPPRPRPERSQREESPAAAPGSVTHLPELLSHTYRNRVPKLSPSTRNPSDHHEPETHNALVVGPLWIEPAEEPEDEEDPSEEGPSAAERRGRGDRI